MSNEKNMQKLAKFMGWEDYGKFWNQGETNVKNKDGSYGACVKRIISKEDFDPFTDHNHYRMLEEKIMEDKDLLLSFRSKFEDASWDANASWENYMKADLETRCNALLSLLDHE